MTRNEETGPKTGPAAEEHLLARVARRVPTGSVGMVLLLVVCFAIAGLAALVGRKGYFEVDGWPLFYGVAGLAGVALTAGLAWFLRPLLRGPEDSPPPPNPGSEADV